MRGLGRPLEAFGHTASSLPIAGSFSSVTGVPFSAIAIDWKVSPPVPGAPGSPLAPLHSYVVALADVNALPPFAQFAPAGSAALVTLTPFVPGSPFGPCG